MAVAELARVWPGVNTRPDVWRGAIQSLATSATDIRVGARDCGHGCRTRDFGYHFVIGRQFETAEHPVTGSLCWRALRGLA